MSTTIVPAARQNFVNINTSRHCAHKYGVPGSETSTGTPFCDYARFLRLLEASFTGSK